MSGGVIGKERDGGTASSRGLTGRPPLEKVRGKGRSMYDDANTVKKTFDQEFLSEYLRQAQWAEMIELKKAINEISRRKGGQIAILDIGIGNARIPKHLSGIKEIWDMVGSYDGIDNAENCIGISNVVVSEMGLGDKVSVKQMDAANLGQVRKKYDLVIVTWFTAGNFYPDDFPFEGYGKGSERYDLGRNAKFEKVFGLAYKHLNPGGEIIIGSAYIDNESTRKRQEDFYRKCGMTVITGPEDSFTATVERFWSQRFTEERMKKYLYFVPSENISFIALDTYEFAMMVRIRK